MQLGKSILLCRGKGRGGGEGEGEGEERERKWEESVGGNDERTKRGSRKEEGRREKREG